MNTDGLKPALLGFQRSEITEHHIYLRLASLQRDAQNRAVIERIAADEKRHAEHWRRHTGQDVEPDWGKVRRYVWISRLLGFTFGAKLMERGEDRAQAAYGRLPSEIAEAAAIQHEEGEHERALLDMLDEERLRYVGSIVLGLNDALVELTGALAGLTLALQNTRLIAMTGCIMGIAAALSMAASEYLSTKAEGKDPHPVKAALYTGTTYVLTVVLLILPYLLLSSFLAALACTLAIAVAIIAAFNFYIAVAKDQRFRSRFIEMAGLSLSVTAISFLVGLALRMLTGGDA
ncbi:MAG: VIT1/CCC1 transporter family protein [Kiritimatiellae bacterium]|nr:VIT1/CCC1 transporter family protein [Kiritimatiellia bacterium]